jgi:hypothetical protein
MTITLDTPEQITMWVLLSRRSQLKMQMKGYRTNGLVKWCKANIPGCENARTAKDCIVPVEYEIAERGGPHDYSIVNVHVMHNDAGYFWDRGIYPNMDAVESNPFFVSQYQQGKLELVFTLEEPRDANGKAYLPG